MRIPCNVIDEAFIHTDEASQPPIVHVEARVVGRLDEDRLRAALRTAAERHPMARARVAPWRSTDRYLEWEVDDTVPDTLLVLDVDELEQLDILRGELISRSIPLDASPPWRARLVHGPDGDAVMLSVHHAASDGVGSLRLLRSVLRAYAGVADPVPDVDPVAAHALDVATGAPAGMGGMGGIGSLPARLAPDGASDTDGCGIVTRRIESDLVVASALRQRVGATVNDVLVAALHLTFEWWNTIHRATTGRVDIGVPVNVRPAAWRDEVVGNLITTARVATNRSQRESPIACLTAVVEATRAIKAGGAAASLAALATFPRLSIGMTRLATAGAFQMGGRFVESSVLSNLGRIGPDFVASDEVRVDEVIFSAPTPMPFGFGIAVASTEQWLSLCLRHRYARLDHSAADAFANGYLHQLQLLAQLDPS